MRRVKSTNTSIEITVRKLIWRMGCRYRLYAKDLPGRPDIILRKQKKIIFINGCFWHGHICKHGQRQPKSNSEYWTKKIKMNKDRDRCNLKKLREVGWRVIVIWECEIVNHNKLKKKLKNFLNNDATVACI